MKILNHVVNSTWNVMLYYLGQIRWTREKNKGWTQK